MKTTSKVPEWYVRLMFISCAIYAFSNGLDPDEVLDDCTSHGNKSPYTREIIRLAGELVDHGVRLALTNNNTGALRYLAVWGEEYRPHLRDCILLAAENHQSAPSYERIHEQVTTERAGDTRARSTRAKATHKRKRAEKRQAALAAVSGK